MTSAAAATPARGLIWLGRLATWKRLALGLLPAIPLFWLVPGAWPPALRLLAAWDGFALSTLLLTWALILGADAGHVRRIATREDPGRVLSFGFGLAAALASLGAVVVLLSFLRQAAPALVVAHVVVSTVSVLSAWLLVHTLFTLRYAHLYYGAPRAGQVAGGLEFPGAEQALDYLDFAYFAFVIGMTAQTADVSISGRGIRRLALLHGLLSFGFNTAVVALTISGLAGVL